MIVLYMRTDCKPFESTQFQGRNLGEQSSVIYNTCTAKSSNVANVGTLETVGFK